MIEYNFRGEKSKEKSDFKIKVKVGNMKQETRQEKMHRGKSLLEKHILSLTSLIHN